MDIDIENIETKNAHDFDTLLEQIEVSTLTERDKGTQFETLVRTFLAHDAEYKDLFTEIYTVKQFAASYPDLKINAIDAGIDLYCKNKDDDKFTAVQCKFYKKNNKLISKKDLNTFLSESEKNFISKRLFVTTQDIYFTDNAELASLDDKLIPLSFITRCDFYQSTIAWSSYVKGEYKQIEKRTLRPYQKEVIKNSLNGFKTNSRGTIIMACGTGKTFTSLRLTEEYLNSIGGGENTKLVLFAVPSLALLSQTLKDWKHQSLNPITAFAVCSDTKIGKADNEDIDQIGRMSDLAYPATTEASDLAKQVKLSFERNKDRTVVIFSTYHSLDIVSKAQLEYGMQDIDITICDEAHRTAGGNLVNEKESKFTRIHKDEFIKSTKRLYMTATPKIYAGDALEQKERGEAIIYSMDDESIYGPKFDVLSFTEAVRLNCLVDYKVIVLTVDESVVGNSFINDAIAEGGLSIPHAAKVIGCWKALQKIDLQDDVTLGDDIQPMKRAVGFAQIINKSSKSDKVSSKEFTEHFQSTIDTFIEYTISKNKDNKDFNEALFRAEHNLRCECQHIDGSMNALEKTNKIEWLKEEPDDDICKILFNVRCLSEGVDVPALDSVMFLSPRKSQVDVVQTVGRVMRKAPGKRRGYVIIPLVVPKGRDANSIISNNAEFKVVWQVLNALKSIDSNFGTVIDGQLGKIDKNKLEVVCISQNSFTAKNLAEKKSLSKSKISKKGKKRELNRFKEQEILGHQSALEFEEHNIIQDAIETAIVKQIGNRREWEDWAAEVGEICQEQINLIKDAIYNKEDDLITKKFSKYKNEFKATLNKNITDDDVIEILAQHIVIKPVMDALFKNDRFSTLNPISIAMTSMLSDLDNMGMQKATKKLEGFYDAVKIRMKNINTATERQTVIIELFDKFFKQAFPKLQEKLGIVYTPIEIVDFIINSVSDILETDFNSSIDDDNVHILDPFTGTGIFITRLLQSGRININKLSYKYKNDIHAHEIMPLAYYIACVNIESTYYELLQKNGMKEEYKSNNIMVLTDTFEDKDNSIVFESNLKVNHDRILKINDTDIRIIIGNPPYSVGQKSANDNNQNEHYESIENRIYETYSTKSNTKNRKGLQDSYIKAIRWASDKIKNTGIIAFVVNGSWIYSKNSDGFRACLYEEFDKVFVYNLKGRQKNGAIPKIEGESIFGNQSTTSVAILFLIKNNKNNGSSLFYKDIGDGLTRKDKLEIIKTEQSILKTNVSQIIPDRFNDWINLRDDSLHKFISILEDKEIGIFSHSELGVTSSRNAYVYNSSKIN